MGWTTLATTLSPKEYFTNYINKCEGLELVDIAVVNLRTVYMAVRVIELDYVYCLVYLIHNSPKAVFNFGYKDMSEFCGPNAYDCPKRILDVLTPLDKIKQLEPDFGDNSFEWAKNWREENLRVQTKGTELTKALRKGKIIKSNILIKFGNHYHIQYFRKEGRKIFGIINYGEKNQFEIQVRFRGMKNYDFEIIEK